MARTLLCTKPKIQPVNFLNNWENYPVGTDVTDSGPNNWGNIERVADNRAQVVSNISRSGDKSLRIEVRPGDNPTGASNRIRCELKWMIGADGDEVHELPNTQFYYGFSLRLSSPWHTPGSTGWNCFIQLFPSSGLSGINANFNFVGTKGVYSCSTSGSVIGWQSIALSDNDLTVDTWNDWIFRILWSTGTSGEVEVWRRRQNASSFDRVALVTGRSNHYGYDDGYWKTGLYTSPQDTETNVLHQDNWCRADTFEAIENILNGG